MPPDLRTTSNRKPGGKVDVGNEPLKRAVASCTRALARRHIDVVDIPARSRAKQRNEPAPERLPERRFDDARIVGRVLRPAHGIEVKRKAGKAGDRPFIPGGAEEHDPHVRIDRPGRSNDVRIECARIESDRAVLHVEPSVERQSGLVRVARDDARIRNSYQALVDGDSEAKGHEVIRSRTGAGRERPLPEKVADDAFVNCIHFRLRRVAELVQAAAQDVDHGEGK